MPQWASHLDLRNRTTWRRAVDVIGMGPADSMLA